MDVAVGDLNGDGKLDIVTVTRNSNNVLVLLGNGDGTFAAPVSYWLGDLGLAWPTGIALGDFNNDGNLDVVVVASRVGSDGDKAMVLLGNGDGTLRPPLSSPASASPLGVAVGDLNGDGNLDLLIASNGSAVFLLGQGDGTFQPAQYLPPPGLGYAQWGAGMADLNRDGRMDVFTVSPLSGIDSILAVYLAREDGTFPTPTLYHLGLPEASFVTAADLNGDNIPDLIATEYQGNGISVLIGRGDGTFVSPSNIYGGTNPTRAVVADFNRDGKPDIATSDFNQPQYYLPDNFGVSVIPGNGDGTFDFGHGFIQFDAGSQAAAIAVGDFNGDGAPDIVTANFVRKNSNSNNISVLLNGSAMEVTLSSSVEPALPDEEVTLTVTVAPVSGTGPVPTGTTIFLDDSITLGTATLDLSGRANLTRRFAPGTHPLMVLYSGDSAYVGSSSAVFFERVGYPTRTTLSALPGDPNFGTPVTFTAVVTSEYGNPTGSVRFADGSSFLGTATVSGGMASLTTSSLARGSHTVTATYYSSPVGFLSSSGSVEIAVH